MASSGGDGDHHRDPRQVSDDRLKQRLESLEKRLDTVSGEHKKVSEDDLRRRSSALGKAFKLSTELVAGVFGGGVIGWLLDQWLGTAPLLLVIFLMLGVAAGLLNAVRTARQMSSGN